MHIVPEALTERNTHIEGGGPGRSTSPASFLDPRPPSDRARSPGEQGRALSWLDNPSGFPGPQGNASDPSRELTTSAGTLPLLPAPPRPSPPAPDILWGPKRKKPAAERSEAASPLGNVCISDRDFRTAGQLAAPGHPRRQVMNTVSLFPGGVIAQGFRGPGAPPPGGLRGQIYGFSKASRRRMRHRMMQVDWEIYDLSYVVLTYHKRWGDPWMWKRDHQTLDKRLFRAFPDSLVGTIWRLEFQTRAAPHFNLILVWKKHTRPHNEALHVWLRRAWSEIIGTENDQAALRHGVDITPVSPGRGGLGRLLGYLVNEMGKVSQSIRVDRATGELLPTGRMWGITGGVPLVAAILARLSPEAWAAFIARVNQRGDQVGSWYLSAISLQWPGFTIMGSMFEIAPLFYDLPDS